MPDESLSTWQDGAMRGLLSALWSFLQHPATVLEDHLSSVEARLSSVEERIIGDVQAAVDKGVVAVEDTVAGVEHRLEEDFKRAIRGRVAGIQARLEIVRGRVVEDLKHELRRVVLILALVMGCALLALVGVTFGLMAAWTDLQGFLGSVGASLVLAALFLLASVVVFRVLHSTLHHAHTDTQ
jgi:hypothetical protein